MASHIPGYEYDIFISYRQKDNKHDGWVTEFVNNLKGELESTFKDVFSTLFLSLDLSRKLIANRLQPYYLIMQIYFEPT